LGRAEAIGSMTSKAERAHLPVLLKAITNGPIRAVKEEIGSDLCTHVSKCLAAVLTHFGYRSVALPRPGEVLGAKVAVHPLELPRAIGPHPAGTVMARDVRVLRGQATKSCSKASAIGRTH
jgi:hypothetical protein